MEPVNLETSQQACRDISRLRAKNFYYGMKLVPEPKRSAQYAFYAWNRLADDLADEAGSEEEKIANLAQFKADTYQVMDQRELAKPELPEGKIWPAFHDLLHRYPVTQASLDAMIVGQLGDQEKSRYATFEELYEYCFQVASVVGLSCIDIWGYEGGEDTRKLAEWRGIAFQLTNILRDVREDAQRDRIYLPQDACEGRLEPAMLLNGRNDQAIEVIHSVAEKAAGYYQQSADLDDLVHSDGLACLWAMTSIYRGLLHKILNDPGCVLDEKRVKLGSVRKSWIALRASLLRGQRSG